MSVGTFLLRSARRYPDDSAVAQGELTRSYRELAERVTRLAGAFRIAGLDPGDRVGTLMPNRPELIETMLACFHAGLCVVPVNARCVPGEAARMLGDAEVRAVVQAPEYAPHVDAVANETELELALETGEPYESAIAGASAIPLHDVGPETPAWLFYTSGTTGGMKGATLTHRNLTSMVVSQLADLHPLRAEDVVLHAAPLTHGSGLYALAPVACGSAQVITCSASFDPEEALELVARERVSAIAFLAPTMLRRLTAAQARLDADFRSVRCVVYGGAPMYLEDLKDALAAFGPVLAQIYGQAEAPVSISRLTPRGHAELMAAGDDARLASAGLPYTATQVQVVDQSGAKVPVGEVGEVIVKGDVVMAGYWRDAEATDAAISDGWLFTGDLGRFDEEGWLALVDRSRDVIITGAANVYPREIEEVVLTHKEVREVAVVGAPDREWGERVVCAVVPISSGGEREMLRADLVRLCRERLAGYKLPREWLWLDELPKSAYGKVLKRELRDRLWEGHERRI
jgi:long-chain acyl-CoA synthetase